MAQNRKNNQNMDPMTVWLISGTTSIDRKGRNNLQRWGIKTSPSLQILEIWLPKKKKNRRRKNQLQRASEDPVLKIQLHPVSLGTSLKQSHSLASEIPSNPSMWRENWKWWSPTSSGLDWCPASHTCTSREEPSASAAAATAFTPRFNFISPAAGRQPQKKFVFSRNHKPNPSCW